MARRDRGEELEQEPLPKRVEAEKERCGGGREGLEQAKGEDFEALHNASGA